MNTPNPTAPREGKNPDKPGTYYAALESECKALAVRDADAAEIGALYQEARSGMVGSVQRLLEVGRRLAAKKKTLEHGEWLRWLTANADVLGFDTRRTAARLIEQAAKCDASVPFDEAQALRTSRQIWGHEKPHRALGTGDNEWNTPVEYLEAARRVMGGFDCCPASNAFAKSRFPFGAKCTHYTQEDNGLLPANPWHGRVWLNPPYARGLIEPFVARLLDEYGARRVSAAIMLTNNNTDAKWFQSAARAARNLCFTAGRIEWEKENGDNPNTAQGQAFFFFGRQDGMARKFREVFDALGFVR